MATQLKEGDIAPDFQGVNQNGEIVTLSHQKGKKVILYFYPKDDTPGCTAEACNLNDNFTQLIEKGFEIIGVSPDDVHSHKKFSQKYGLKFNLIADTDKTILQEYGVWGEKNMYGKISMGVIRTTFIIDENNIILKIIKKVDTKNHTEQILTLLEK
ncbi:MAG: thioredoxin-dependent thiol peroxidase [Bacteroidales bacterium]